jgi:hypothetical protein
MKCDQLRKKRITSQTLIFFSQNNILSLCSLVSFPYRDKEKRQRITTQTEPQRRSSEIKSKQNKTRQEAETNSQRKWVKIIRRKTNDFESQKQNEENALRTQERKFKQETNSNETGEKIGRAVFPTKESK